MPHSPNPLPPAIPTSLLVVANIHPLLSLVYQQLPYPLPVLPPFTPHRSSYNIYIDDINNSSHPRLLP